MQKCSTPTVFFKIAKKTRKEGGLRFWESDFMPIWHNLMKKLKSQWVGFSRATPTFLQDWYIFQKNLLFWKTDFFMKIHGYNQYKPFLTFEIHQIFHFMTENLGLFCKIWRKTEKLPFFGLLVIMAKKWWRHQKSDKWGGLDIFRIRGFGIFAPSSSPPDSPPPHFPQLLHTIFCSIFTCLYIFYSVHFERN